MPVKPDGVGQRPPRRSAAALRLDQRGDQRHRVIGERRGAHRIAAVAGAVARGEGAEAASVGRRHTSRPRSAGFGEDCADRPTGRCRAAAPAWCRRRSRPAPAPTAGTPSAPSGMNSASAWPPPAATAAHRPLHAGSVERIALERDDAAAAARHRLLERGLHHGAVGIVREQRGERALALRERRSRRCGRRRTPAGSSADRRRARRRWRRSRRRSPARRARRATWPTGPHRLREQRPEDDLGAFVDAPAARPAARPAAVPPSSLTRSWMSGLLNSASAISAALRMDCAATPGIAGADSGRMQARP